MWNWLLGEKRHKEYTDTLKRSYSKDAWAQSFGEADRVDPDFVYKYRHPKTEDKGYFDER